MALDHSQIADLVTTTQKELGRMKFTDIASDLQHYEVLGKLLKKENVESTTGEGVQRNVMVTTSGSAEHVGLFNTDNVNVGDVMKTIQVPLRFSQASYAFDVREKAINSGPEQIVDLIKVRRLDAEYSLAQLMETTFWSKPATSDDNVTPWGVYMFVVKNSSTGFNGGAPAGFSTYGGLSSTTYPRWRNYTAQYTGVTKLDLIKKMRTGHRKTHFESPVSIPDYRTNRGQKYVVYTNEAVVQAFEDLGEAQNENLGRDLAPYDGEMTFRRNPVRWVPHLDADTTNPVLMLNWSSIKFICLKGFYMKEGKPQASPSQHNVMNVFIDMSWNTLCTDRRRNAIFYV